MVASSFSSIFSKTVQLLAVVVNSLYKKKTQKLNDVQFLGLSSDLKEKFSPCFHCILLTMCNNLKKYLNISRE